MNNITREFVEKNVYHLRDTMLEVTKFEHALQHAELQRTAAMAAIQTAILARAEEICGVHPNTLCKLNGISDRTVKMEINNDRGSMRRGEGDTKVINKRVKLDLRGGRVRVNAGFRFDRESSGVVDFEPFEMRLLSTNDTYISHKLVDQALAPGEKATIEVINNACAQAVREWNEHMTLEMRV